MTVLGLDIGGANIKAATIDGHAVARSFPIWKCPELLTGQIESLRQSFPETTQLAVTMTAELADCFSTKAQGVSSIVSQLESTGLPVSVWTTSGQFVNGDEARRMPMLVAAANWHALATWVGRQPGVVDSTETTALLIDIGTTTTDIIPLISGMPATVGRTDTTRLVSGELCYSGIKRTPLCAVAHSVPFRDGYCPLAAEVFATMLDVYLLLGEIPEDEHDLETANGRPATRQGAYDRIARMLCADRDEVTLNEAQQVARFIGDVQRQRLAGALERVVARLPGPCGTVVVSGSGAFLARKLVTGHRRLMDAKVVSLDKILSPSIAEAACAYAVAQLCPPAG